LTSEKLTPPGLRQEEAEQRRARYGYNEPTVQRRRGAFTQLLQLFANPLVLILLLAAGVSATLGETVSATVIFVIVLLGIAVNFVQTFRSQQAVERLRQQVASTATVKRDGQWQELPRRELVPGDVIRLSAGDLVPADATLAEALDLHVQEAALTGESMPVEKSPGDPSPTKESPHSTVYMGTSVVSGTALAIVSRTGKETVFGDLAARLATAPPETEFDRGARRYSLFIMETVVFLVLFVFLVSIVLKRDAFESLLFAVALAVGLTPEFLPMIISVTLGQGAVQMSRKRVIVKHLGAMQNFGSMDVLCSDKTGTLTTGAIALTAQLNPDGEPSDEIFPPAYLNSYFETGIRSPLDAAILAAQKPNIDGYQKLDEVPFDFELRRLSVVISHGNERRILTKGAPESIWTICTSCRVRGEVVAWDASRKLAAERILRELGEQGCRVLAVAERQVEMQPAYRAADERELTLLGYLAFFDPPLTDAAETIQDLRDDGVRIVVLTGDNELVTRHVCSEVGLDGQRIILGSDVDELTDTALGAVAEQTSIFARVSPAQKNRVVNALKRRGHVVGFLGDGINDAPSLHAADVGISVASAADVAKDAAEIILLDHNLRVLHLGVLEGRKAFGNVMKYLLMGTSSNFGNMFSMAAASLFLPFLPMTPIQILLNNFLYDFAQITIPTDNVDESFIKKPHRWDISLIREFMLYIGPISSLFDFVTFYVLLYVLKGSEKHFHTGWFVESLATQTLVLFVIRTAGNPFRSRPSIWLSVTVTVVVLIAIGLPYTPLSFALGLVPMSAAYYLFLAGETAIYLAIVQRVKRWLFEREN
jgi:Mg2+-importing ATPase